MRFTTLCGGLLPDCFMAQFTIFLVQQVEFTGAPRTERVMPDHNTGNLMLYSLRIVCGFFNVPQLFKGCETGPPAYTPYPRRLESLTICWCDYKGSTFYSVILRPWVLVRPESNSQPPASQPNAQQLSHRCDQYYCRPLWQWGYFWQLSDDWLRQLLKLKSKDDFTSSLDKLK